MIKREIEYYENYFCIVKEMGNRVVEGVVYCSFGIVYCKLGDYI